MWKLISPPMIHRCLPAFSWEIVDGGIAVNGIVIVMSRGNFLKDAAGFGPETVPHTRHDEAGVAGVECALLPVAREVEDAV